MIKGFAPRLYQQTIFGVAAAKNTLVVLPTGLGKTAIAMMLAVHRLKQFPNSKIVFLAPTKPLCQQHLDVFRKYLEIGEEKMALFTGEMAPNLRQEQWKDCQIIFSTPQGLENDVVGGKILLKEVSLMIFDECHRAVGDYSYVWLAQKYNGDADFPRLLGLTASPGSELEKIQEVCRNLFIEAVEAKNENDSDVKPYVKDIDVEWIKLDLPAEFSSIQKILIACYKKRLDALVDFGLAKRADMASKKDLLEMQARLHAAMSSGEKDFALFKSVSILAQAVKIHHALELVESQGIGALHSYMSKLFEEAKQTRVKAVQALANDKMFSDAFEQAKKLFDGGVKHPKLIRLKEIVEAEAKAKRDIKIIVFCQYRDSGSEIVNELNEIPGVIAKLFVGQMKKGETGLNQKKQKEMLDEFRDGMFNALVCTSVGEEGLDIPRVDLVIFHEPIPSAIRTIQRRGRTGRQESGRVIVLIAKNTRDEAYSWIARRKEQQMTFLLKQLKNKFAGKLSEAGKMGQQTLENFKPAQESGQESIKNAKLKILVDHRESGSGVLRGLSDLGAEIELKVVSADYILSDRVGVEFKTAEDFVNSIVDGRLLGQLKCMAEEFEKPIVVVEGEQDIYSIRGVHPNAIRGALATIAVSYGIPVLQTKNPRETAALLFAIAKREQEEGASREFSGHTKKPLTLKEQQEYVVSALPNVGANLAKQLLKQFGTIKSIVNANDEDLKKVDGIGDKKAARIREVLESEHKKE
jgi:Fanconi anemia group M protein